MVKEKTTTNVDETIEQVNEPMNRYFFPKQGISVEAKSLEEAEKKVMEDYSNKSL